MRSYTTQEFLDAVFIYFFAPTLLRRGALYVASRYSYRRKEGLQEKKKKKTYQRKITIQIFVEFTTMLFFFFFHPARFPSSKAFQKARLPPFIVSFSATRVNTARERPRHTCAKKYTRDLSHKADDAYSSSISAVSNSQIRVVFAPPFDWRAHETTLFFPSNPQIM